MAVPAGGAGQIPSGHRCPRAERGSPGRHAASRRRSLLMEPSANSRAIDALFHHQDAVGEGEHRLGFGRDHHDGDDRGHAGRRTIRTTSSLAPTSMPRVGSLRTSTLGAICRATWPAPPSADCRRKVLPSCALAFGRPDIERGRPAGLGELRARAPALARGVRNPLENRDRGMFLYSRLHRWNSIERRLSGTKATPAFGGQLPCCASAPRVPPSSQPGFRHRALILPNNVRASSTWPHPMNP